MAIVYKGGEEHSANLLTLAQIKPGMKVRFMGIQSGRDLKARLIAMGLAPGVILEVIRNSQTGPFIVGIDHSRLVLGRGMAHKILVS